MLRRRTAPRSELSHRVVGKTATVLSLCPMSVRRGPTPPWTPSPLVSSWVFECVRVKYSGYSCVTTPQNLMGFTFVLSQTRGRMMRSMSATWAGRPSKLAATRWRQRSSTGIRLRKTVRRWRPTWSAYTPYQNSSSSCAAWRKVTFLFSSYCQIRDLHLCNRGSSSSRLQAIC